MAVNLSIKAVPNTLVEKLRKRAEKNHRSLQGEMLTILEESLEGPRPLTSEETIRRLRQIKLKTDSQATLAIRHDRNRH